MARFNRRRFIKVGLVASGAVVASLTATGAVWFRAGPPADTFKIISENEVKFINAFVEAHFPPGNAIGVEIGDLGDIPRTFDEHLAGLGLENRRKVRLALSLLDSWPRLSFNSLGRLGSLSLERRIAVLSALEKSDTHALRSLSELGRAVLGIHLFQNPKLLAAIGHQIGCGV